MTQLGWLLVKWATNRERDELAVCMKIPISTKIWNHILKLEYLQSENSIKTNVPCIIVLNHRLVEYNAIEWHTQFLCYLWTAFEMSWLVLVVFAFSGPDAARLLLQQHVSAVNNTAAVEAFSGNHTWASSTRMGRPETAFFHVSSITPPRIEHNRNLMLRVL